MNDSNASPGAWKQLTHRGGGAMIGALTLLALALMVTSLIVHLVGAPDVGIAVAAPAAPPAPSVEQLLANIDRPSLVLGEDGKYSQQIDGIRVVYTLDPDLQQKLTKTFSRYKVPYGAFVAIEPATGRVLALAEYSANEPEANDLCFRASYPAASLIKVITAAAALETGEVTAKTDFRYEGNPYRMSQRKISPKNRRRHNQATFAEALGHSNNLIFGEVGADIVGSDKLLSTLFNFGFNREIPFDLPLQASSASVPEERYPLARTAAGLGDVHISPVHAALIAAAVGNGGVMMQPYVVDRMEDSEGNLIYVGAPQPYGRVVSTEVADELAAMMEKTITKGTGTKMFYRNARKLVRTIDIAGKTGSLTGDNPPGKYEWFIGFAPADNPQIAVAGLVVNQGDLWHIKGTYTGMTALREHFDL